MNNTAVDEEIAELREELDECDNLLMNLEKQQVSIQERIRHVTSLSEALERKLGYLEMQRRLL